jgi:hypothetical protein
MASKILSSIADLFVSFHFHLHTKNVNELKWESNYTTKYNCFGFLHYKIFKKLSVWVKNIINDMKKIDNLK